MKYPIGIQSFEKIRNEGFVYVDKTDLIYSIVNDGKPYFLIRPHGFGKSLLLSTIEAYFLGKRELFAGLKIDALETQWKSYPVFHLSLGEYDFTKPDVLLSVLEKFVADAESVYGKCEYDKTLGSRFVSVLKNAYKKTGLRAVVLIDDYDKPVLDAMGLDVLVENAGYTGKLTLEEYNRNILRSFYGIFKAADKYLKHVFMAGETTYLQDYVLSDFNQRCDISVGFHYDTLCGITKQELTDYFHDRISEICEHDRCAFDQMVETLHKQYGGYHFSDHLTEVYNPAALFSALDEGRVRDCWLLSQAPDYLLRLFMQWGRNVADLPGKYYSELSFLCCRDDTANPLPILYQNGYFTISGYKLRTNVYELDFPNDDARCSIQALEAIMAALEKCSNSHMKER